LDFYQEICTFYIWKHLFKYCDFEICESEDEADVVCFSVFGKFIETFVECNKRMIMFTGEPIAIDCETFKINFSFHISEHKNVILFPHFMMQLFNVEIPRTISLKSLPPRTTIPPKFCCFMTKQYKNERVDFFYQLSNYKQVDSIGSLLNNIGFQTPWDHDECISIISQYKFIISFENTQLERYVTEKILHGFHAQVIPIYWGSQYVHEFFNQERIVYIGEYVQEQIEEAIEKIKELDQDDEKYLEMVNKPVFAEEFDPDEYFKQIQNAIPFILSS